MISFYQLVHSYLGLQLPMILNTFGSEILKLMYFGQKDIFWSIDG
jgi:hypothetical protein